MKVWDIEVWLGHIKKLSMIFKLMVKGKKTVSCGCQKFTVTML